MTFITLNFENNSFFLIFAATFFDILTKSYHIQRRPRSSASTASCELLTKSYHIQRAVGIAHRCTVVNC